MLHRGVVCVKQRLVMAPLERPNRALIYHTLYLDYNYILSTLTMSATSRPSKRLRPAVFRRHLGRSLNSAREGWWGADDLELRVRCDVEGVAKIRSRETRAQRSGAEEWRSWGEALGVDEMSRRFALDEGPLTKPREFRPEPPPELVARVEALGSWEDLLRSGARGLAELLAEVAKGGEATREIEMSREEYTPLALEVMALGFYFKIDALGKPHVAVETPQGSGINTERIIQAARDLGCGDEEILDELVYGLDPDDDRAPQTCRFSPNQLPASGPDLERVRQSVREELQAGWLEASVHPPSIPVAICPIACVRKSDYEFSRKVRVVINASHPRGRFGLRLGPSGEWDELRPLSPNDNADAAAAAQVAMMSLAGFSVSVSILAEVARRAGTGLVGKRFDYKAWFRQLASALRCRWKVVVALDGRFYWDKRVQMGWRLIPGKCHRVAIVIRDIVLVRLDAKFARDFAECRDSWYLSAREFAAQRIAACGGDVTQGRLYFLDVYQDDTGAATLTPLAEWLEAACLEIYANLGVALSGKELPFAPVFDLIGGRYDFSDMSGLKLGPTESFFEEYAAAAVSLRVSQVDGIRVELATLRELAGCHEWLANFVPEGSLWCGQVHANVQLASLAGGRAQVSGEMCEAFEKFVTSVRGGQLCPLICDSLYLFSVMGTCADACTTVGYGFCVGWRLYYGRWSDETLRALWEACDCDADSVADSSRAADAAAPLMGEAVESVTVSISPLELLTQGLLAHEVGRLTPLDFPVKRWSLRCDNTSAIAVANSRRPRSARMRIALEILREAEILYGCSFRLWHIPTRENKIADLLSRGQIAKAVEMTFQLYGKVEVCSLDAAWVRDCERRVREASL